MIRDVRRPRYSRVGTLGATCPGQTTGFFDSRTWDYIFYGCPPASAIAPPAAPTGSVLTVPPADGEDAQSTVDALLNQQMRDQQAKNAAGVHSTWFDEAAGGLYNAGDAAVNAVTPPSWLLPAAVLGGSLVLLLVVGVMKK